MGLINGRNGVEVRMRLMVVPLVAMLGKDDA